MIYITGDIHGDPRRFNTFCFPEQQEMTKEDVVIICGDFGLIWNYKGESSEENYWLNWLNDKPFTTVFVDGNHENFNRLYSYPVKEWNGGKVREIRPSVLHLMRGEVYDIEGLKFFAFGGASSHDIEDGIVTYDTEGKWKNTARCWEMENKMFRIENVSWWAQELPTEEEKQNGIDNLEKVGNTVDYVITHSPSASIIAQLGNGAYEQDCLTLYLEKLREKIQLKKWFSGHMHCNKMIGDKDIILYEQIIRIA